MKTLLKELKKPGVTLFSVLLIMLLISSCSEPDKVLVLSLPDDDIDEYIVKVDIDELGANDNLYPIFFDAETNDSLTSQLVFDENDEVQAVLVAVSANGQKDKKIRPEWVNANVYPSFQNRTNVRIGYSENKDKNYVDLQSHVRPEGHVQGNLIYQAEGPIWESELIAFRSYFDPRNGKDIFGKVVEELCANQIGVSGNYHEMQAWGMDILKVGSSLGAGAFGMLKNNEIFRLGETESAQASIDIDGPLLSSLVYDYKGWVVDGTNYDVAERISILAGQRFYTSEISLSGGTEADTLITGIVNLHNIDVKNFDYKGYKVLYTHGIQSYKDEVLGMALIIPLAQYAGYRPAPDSGEGITNTHVAYLKPGQEGYKYHFFAGWEKEESQFKEENFFVEALKKSIDFNEAKISKTIINE